MAGFETPLSRYSNSALNIRVAAPEAGTNFYDALALRELVVALGVFGHLPFVEGPDAVVRNSGPVDIQVGKAAAEVGHLPFDLFGG